MISIRIEQDGKPPIIIAAIDGATTANGIRTIQYEVFEERTEPRKLYEDQAYIDSDLTENKVWEVLDAIVYKETSKIYIAQERARLENILNPRA